MTRIDNNLIKVSTLIAGYVALLVIANYSAWSGTIHAVLGIFFSRQIALTILLALTVVLIVPYGLWSRIFHFVRRPLDIVVTLITIIVAAFGFWLLFFSVEQAHVGHLSAVTLLAGAVLLFAVAYLNSFLYSLSERYEAANQEKIRAEQFKSELITNVSHDIQTPLTSIINYSDLLLKLSSKDEEFDKKFSDYTEVIDRKSKRLKTLANDLIEASKSSTGSIEADIQAVDLTEVIWQVAGEFDDRFKERKLEFIFNPPVDLPQVMADPRHLWRILENLFNNVEKYSLEGTRSFVQLELLPPTSQEARQLTALGNKPDTFMAFSMKNTSAEPLEQLGGELTEQFMRGDKARNTEGSGLGLYIAKSLAELMGGSFNVHVSGDQFETRILFRIQEDIN